MVFNVSDVERTTRFWTEIMGFHITDRNDRGMVFLRNTSDHHTMGLAPAVDSGKVPNADGVRFSHCALEVSSVSELYTIRDFLRAKGLVIQFEGRRGPGCNVGVEFQDFNGFNIEIYAAMDQIGWDGKSRPANERRRAKSIEGAVNNSVPGAKH